MDGLGLPRRAGGLGKPWDNENPRGFFGRARAIICGRRTAAAGTRDTRRPCQPDLADPGRGMPIGSGAGACDEVDRSRHDPEQLCVPDDDLVVADGPAVGLWNVAVSEEGGDRERHSRLEGFFRASSVSDAGEAAANLVREFPTLSEALSAEPILVADFAGAPAARALHAAHALMVATLEERLVERAEISTAKDAEQFLQQLIGFRCVELLVVLFLDSGRRLIGHELLGAGRVDSVDFDPRRILLRALGRGAAGIIIAHNHPSGDPAPSHSDLMMTRRIVGLANGFGIMLHDHIVVSRGRMRSAMFDG